MEKNVIVMDEEGNIIGATYAKRAKGLIKKGRARSVDDNTICLACPPNESLEDIKMDNNIETTTSTETTTNEAADGQVTLKYLLDKLDEVRTSFLESEKKQIALICPPKNMDPNNLNPESLPAIFQNYYETITKIKTTSQTTLQQLTGVYTDLINERKKSEAGRCLNPEERKELLDLVKQYAEKAGPGVLVPDFAGIAHVLYGV